MQSKISLRADALLHTYHQGYVRGVCLQYFQGLCWRFLLLVNPEFNRVDIADFEAELITYVEKWSPPQDGIISSTKFLV